MFFLENDIIGLRALEENDANCDYTNWLNDSEVCKYNSHHRYVVTKNEVTEYVKNCNSRNSIVLAVELKENQMHIGNVSLQNIHYIDRTAEIAFLMGAKECWGRGYATEAARLLINHAFRELGLQRIYFGTSEKNIGMQKIGEKLKFKKEGVRRNAIYKNGEFLNIYEYGLLKEEWEDRNV